MRRTFYIYINDALNRDCLRTTIKYLSTGFKPPLKGKKNGFYSESILL